MALGYAWFDSYDSVGYVLTLHILPPYSLAKVIEALLLTLPESFGSLTGLTTLDLRSRCVDPRPRATMAGRGPSGIRLRPVGQGGAIAIAKARSCARWMRMRGRRACFG